MAIWTGWTQPSNARARCPSPPARYEESFLHGKAYLFGTDLFGAPEGVLVGSSNFTVAGLTHNLELNLGRYDPTPAGQVKDWFDRLWDRAKPYDLAAIYAARLMSTRHI